MKNDEVRLFGAETGKSRWWRFVQAVQFTRASSIGASVPDVVSSIGASVPDVVTLVNVHSPSSNRTGWWAGKEFGTTLAMQTKVEVARRALQHFGRGRTILAGDTNLKKLSELESLTSSDENGQWDCQPNPTKRDDFIVYRGFQRVPAVDRLLPTKAMMDYKQADGHCPVWITLEEKLLQPSVLSSDASGLAAVRHDVINTVASKGSMSPEDASRHFDDVVSELVQKAEAHRAQQEEIEEGFRAEAAAEAAAAAAPDADAPAWPTPERSSSEESGRKRSRRSSPSSARSRRSSRSRGASRSSSPGDRDRHQPAVLSSKSVRVHHGVPSWPARAHPGNSIGNTAATATTTTTAAAAAATTAAVTADSQNRSNIIDRNGRATGSLSATAYYNNDNSNNNNSNNSNNSNNNDDSNNNNNNKDSNSDSMYRNRNKTLYSSMTIAVVRTRRLGYFCARHTTPRLIQAMKITPLRVVFDDGSYDSENATDSMIHFLEITHVREMVVAESTYNRYYPSGGGASGAGAGSSSGPAAGSSSGGASGPAAGYYALSKMGVARCTELYKQLFWNKQTNPRDDLERTNEECVQDLMQKYGHKGGNVRSLVRRWYNSAVHRRFGPHALDWFWEMGFLSERMVASFNVVADRRTKARQESSGGALEPATGDARRPQDTARARQARRDARRFSNLEKRWQAAEAPDGECQVPGCRFKRQISARVQCLSCTAFVCHECQPRASSGGASGPAAEFYLLCPMCYDTHGSTLPVLGKVESRPEPSTCDNEEEDKDPHLPGPFLQCRHCNRWLCATCARDDGPPHQCSWKEWVEWQVGA